MPNAEIIRSDIQIETTLRNRLWTVFHDIPRLYENLLSRVGPMGLTTAEIRTEAGDGSLAGFNVQFWMFQVRLLVRIRLDKVEFQWNRLTREDVPLMIDAMVNVLAAVAAAGEGTVAKVHEVSAALHIALQDASANDVMARLAPSVPEIGPGPLLGSGLAVYFGPHDDVLSSSLGLEPSVVVASGLFARITISCEGGATPHRLQERLENQIEQTLGALGFEWKRVT